MSCICVRDSDKVVIYVATSQCSMGAGHTMHQGEDYDGPFEWNTDEVTVYRHGEGDYQLTPPA